MSVDVECVVIGAGVVGLAVARALALAGRDVVVLEAEGGIGRGISSRNSEVIHAGLYYPSGSCKARFCVEGKAALYRFCADHGVPNRRCGKVVVASGAAQLGQLAAIRARAEANNVGDLEWLAKSDLEHIEPELAGEAGLLSPSTGIIDTHAFMLALRGDLEAGGGTIALATPVTDACATDGAIRLTTGDAGTTELTARHVVLAAGLESAALARSFEGFAPSSIPRVRFAKGSYFGLRRRAPFSRLIYPVPEPGGLGVHLTLDLAGRAKFGPDVEWLDDERPGTIDYRVDPDRAPAFYAAIRTYWPGLRDGDLEAGYSGIRPKLAAKGAPDADFMVQTEAMHGMRGVIALYGIESPGVTASLALAAYVADLVGNPTATL